MATGQDIYKDVTFRNMGREIGKMAGGVAEVPGAVGKQVGAYGRQVYTTPSHYVGGALAGVANAAERFGTGIREGFTGQQYSPVQYEAKSLRDLFGAAPQPTKNAIAPPMTPQAQTAGKAPAAGGYDPYRPSSAVPVVDNTAQRAAAPLQDRRNLDLPRGVNKTVGSDGAISYSANGPVYAANPGGSMDTPYRAQMDEAVRALMGARGINEQGVDEYAAAAKRINALQAAIGGADSRFAPMLQDAGATSRAKMSEEGALRRAEIADEGATTRNLMDNEAQRNLRAAQARHYQTQGELGAAAQASTDVKTGLGGLSELYKNYATLAANMDPKSPEYKSVVERMTQIEGALSRGYGNFIPEGKAEGGMIGAMGPQQHPMMQKYGQYVASAMQAGVKPLPVEQFMQLAASTEARMAEATAPSAMPQNPGMGGQAYAEGGAINVDGRQVLGPGTGKSDSIPAVIDGERPAALSTGEFVLPVEAVKFYGLDRLNKMVANARKNANEYA